MSTIVLSVITDDLIFTVSLIISEQCKFMMDVGCKAYMQRFTSVCTPMSFQTSENE